MLAHTTRLTTNSPAKILLLIATTSYRDSDLDALAYVHQAHGLRDTESLAHGGFADTELGHQLLLGGDPVTRLEPAG
jgi:hypothetical protein